MKKILLLGGSAQQIVAIDKAKELGYYTVLCDFLTDNPGQYHADKFYLVSTTDKEAVLKVAQSEKIDGIIAYASDPAAPTAAYVAEKMGLPGNPYKSVEILCNKDLLRSFLLNNGFDVPVSKGYSSAEEALRDIGSFCFPIIVKPVDSSGSKGITVLYDKTNCETAIEFAFSFSRCKRIIIEEYIVKNHPYLIGGDIFIIDGEVKLWGLLNCHRDEKVNPLVPVGKSYPLQLTDAQTDSVKSLLSQLIKKLGIRFGAMNVELLIDKNDRCFLIDAGPRAGGNMIPDFLGMIFNIDIVKMAIQTAMGENVKCNPIASNGYYATHNLHSDKSGVYSSIAFDDEIEKYIIKKCLYKKEGDDVHFFDNAAKALGIVFMKFESKEEMAILNEIGKHIKVVLKKLGG